MLPDVVAACCRLCAVARASLWCARSLVLAAAAEAKMMSRRCLQDAGPTAAGARGGHVTASSRRRPRRAPGRHDDSSSSAPDNDDDDGDVVQAGGGGGSRRAPAAMTDCTSASAAATNNCRSSAAGTLAPTVLSLAFAFSLRPWSWPLASSPRRQLQVPDDNLIFCVIKLSISARASSATVKLRVFSLGGLLIKAVPS